MAWIALVIAGLLEVGWALVLPATRGFTRLLPTVAFLVLLAGSMYGLSVATRTLPLGTAYAVWVGIGTTGTILLSVMLYRDPVTPARLFFLTLILAGILGLKLVSGEERPAATTQASAATPAASTGGDEQRCTRPNPTDERT